MQQSLCTSQPQPELQQDGCSRMQRQPLLLPGCSFCLLISLVLTCQGCQSQQGDGVGSSNSCREALWLCVFRSILVGCNELAPGENICRQNIVTLAVSAQRRVQKLLRFTGSEGEERLRQAEHCPNTQSLPVPKTGCFALTRKPLEKREGRSDSGPCQD